MPEYPEFIARNTTEFIASELAIYTIYRQPSDFPDEYVCRRQRCGVGTIPNGAEVPMVVHDKELWARGSTLDECRADLHKRTPGLTWVGRQPEDDPVIEEVWI